MGYSAYACVSETEAGGALCTIFLAACLFYTVYLSFQLIIKLLLFYSHILLF